MMDLLRCAFGIDFFARGVPRAPAIDEPYTLLLSGTDEQSDVRFGSFTT